MDAFRLSELERRLNNLIRLGTIQAVDADTARARVTIGSALTYWLPWLTQRAGADRTWWAPSVGEQVMVIAPSGDLNNAVIMPAVYQDAHPAPSSDLNVHRVEYSDGAVIEYDRSTHKLTATIPGDVEVSATDNISADAGGDITADAGGNIAATAGAAATVEAALSIELTAPAITLNGVVVINGPLSQGGGTGGGRSGRSRSPPAPAGRWAPAGASPARPRPPGDTRGPAVPPPGTSGDSGGRTGRRRG